MIFAVVLPVLVGGTGLAIDSAGFYHQQGRMQAVADSAALAVAKELHIYRDDLEELKAVGEVRAEALLTEAGLAESPHALTIGINATVNLITVELEMTAESLLPVGFWHEAPIVVASQARAFGRSKLCVLALHDNKSDTIKADDESLLTAPECAVQSNSTDPNGLNVEEDSRIVSSAICTSGGYEGESGSFEPAPETDCPPLEDPLAERQPPTLSGCTVNDLVIDSSENLTGNTVFCGGLKIEKDAVVTLAPGIYVISGGRLELKDQAQLIGENVSIYFADEEATFSFDKETTIDLTAPKDGPMAGILFFENPAVSKGRDFAIRSENARRLLGTIYLPNAKLKIDTNANVAAESAYTVIVANQLEVKGANLVVNADYGGTDVPVPDGLGPHSSMVRLER
jgi:hypothetical protein